jgi:putative multiple sugar transport system ATP-binding protein
MSDVILEMRNITKTFPGVKALDNVTFSVKRGEIHALVGENGAGKSTLMKVLSGVYPHGTYEGEIYFEGRECRFHNINQSEEVGLVIIHQELALIPYLSITENLFLGNEQANYGVINWNESISRTKELLERVGLHESPNTLITNMGVGKQQ